MTDDSAKNSDSAFGRSSSRATIDDPEGHNNASNIFPSTLSTPNKQVRFNKFNRIGVPEAKEAKAEKGVKDSASTIPFSPSASNAQLQTPQNETNAKSKDDKDLHSVNTNEDQNSYPRLRVSLVSRRRSGHSSFPRMTMKSDTTFANMKARVKSSKQASMNHFTPYPNRLPTVADEMIKEAMNASDDAISEEGDGDVESEYEDMNNPYLISGQEVNKNKSSSSKRFKAPFSPPASLTYKNFDKVCHVDEKGVWNEYGIDINEHLPEWKCLSIDDLFQTPDLGLLAPIERRVEVEDLKFKVVHNTCFEFSLLRAISRAVTGSESHFKTIRKQILIELQENWAQYFVEMSEECGYDVSFLPSMTKPTDFLQKYEEYYRVSVSEPPLFHLQAAASRIGFQFVFFDACNYDNDEVLVHNSRNPVNLRSKDVYFYHFIRTGRVQGSWTYEFMIPLGRPTASTHIEDGSYSIRMFDALLVDRQMSKSSSSDRSDETVVCRTSTDNRIRLNRKPMTVFGVDHRMYAYKPTYSCDLWSLLSELLTGKLSSAPVIFRECLKERYFQAQYYHFSKVRKRRQVKGVSKRDDLDKHFEKKTNVPRDHRGTFEDLDHAAMVFNFSFVVIGMDNNGNFFWRESISTEDDDEPSTRLAFFVAFTTRKPFWHALEEVSRIPPSKSQMLPDMTFTDDTLHMRSLYCRTQPCLVINQVPPWNPYLSVRNGFAYGKNAILKRLGSAFHPVNNLIRRASVTSMNIFARLSRRILGRFFDSAIRVRPINNDDDVSMTEIYFRENP